MNNQKFFLIIAIFLSIFLLNEQWDRQHAVDANGNLLYQAKTENTKSATKSANANVPSAIRTEATPDVPLSKESNSGEFVTVSTDLLTLEISQKGGTITNAWLNDYPIELNSKVSFQLLSDTPNELFQAQSGLLPSEQMPTHHSLFSSAQTHYQMQGDSLVVPLVWTGENGTIVTKNYHFTQGSYVVNIDYQVNNNSNNNIDVTSYTQLVRNALDQSNMMMPTYTGGAKYDDQEVYEKIEFDEFDEQPETTSKGGWLAMIQHYFFVAMIPQAQETHNYSAKVNNGKYLLTIVNTAQSVAPGSTTTLGTNALYIGPKEQSRIDNLAPGLDKTVDYGILFIIAKPLSEILNWIYDYVGSWGYAIIILTILIKLAFYKLSEKSYRSMAGMRKLSPRLAKLKETYGDDKEKMGQKTMELYRKEKINPAAGCLPILVQIPVFISLYWVLLEMVELRQTPFWYLLDLAAPDPFYILPLIMGASMFVQQKLNPPPPDPMQAKIMMALPFVFTIFFLWFPSGLVLYWVINNILSIAQQWFINKRING
ncbi:membrane protein insertase YidC [Candidatus Thioglobus sp.]|jgi:YidC/Oxa1 family membrane protein insertase|uniref:membrane protein insertase YidC n=1 Tax=Candidatus Thioglobus sp. TaxID=2026721 RepID=UPI001D8DCD76|nr:membrane protein insertase YidC [Candidatus Thioglobus sp.]MBT3276867.1 membrane protein insertase YidC [Candidatus Thioglobus sp.]MBT4000514.1 membrane protein insertase YidC [Candidatus Thioglobus sp.]MBT4182015.1 membrane protein insertase YidC [Candidatus Thioglobus sp.]MBT5164798.1 membrane protein insertase YidC [Candidatus Thioglobus sp.]MBT6021822.1 membrane protein insertase YidC [Candidatus Thioglobus sp.]